ncbi:hypothetical protein FPRO05_10425 [Fusarium proliferatum]|uniref:F-box domain-containing protein n=1 Tax=Gibberella intermedia TaxID=948311 RepID=A0A365NDA6_GIBIN|nr:hypothetical protein FPRO05_10425 [Fusarium proliferatum]
MPNISSEPEAPISCASHRPCHLLEAMITMPDVEKPKNPTLAERVSSLSILDRLPPEILYMLLGMLDIQTIASFVRVSFRGHSYIQSLLAYRDLVAFAPQTLMALGKTGLLNLHSVTELHAALRQERCASCVEYGAFFFLPTCERCCWECLRHNPSLRVLPPKEAKRYFGLSEWHIQRLPTISVIPGNYGISRTPSQRSCRLVSVKAAKELGLMVHGSADQLSQVMKTKCKSGGLRVDGRFLQSDPVISQNQDPLLLPSQGNIPADKFFGMASIPFPSLSASGRLENEIIHDDGHYRLRTGRGVRYLRIPIGTFDDDTMCRPYLLITRLPELPDSPWTVMTISQDENGSLTSVISMDPLPEIRTEWHEQHVDVLTLKSTRRFRSGVHEARYNDVPTIAKIACFEWEMRRIEREIWAYSLLEDHHNQHPNKSPIVPKFLAYLTENGRVMGLLLEKVKGSQLAPTIWSAAKPYFPGFIVTLGWSMGT